MIATAKTHKGYKVFDANGQEWTRVIECDTETGRIERRKEQFDRDDWRETIMAAAPLLLVKIGTPPTPTLDGAISLTKMAEHDSSARSGSER